MLQTIFGKETVLLHTADGKPYIAGYKGHISISHSREHLCIALSEHEIGIDTETVQERIGRLRERFLSAAELESLTPTLQNLTLCWAAKEALYKLAGAAAGAMGQHIRLETEHIDGTHAFGAQIGTSAYRLSVPEANDNYVTVVAEKA